MSSIAVVGSGVIGLSTAIRLAEAGHAVTLISGQRPIETTSAVAAAYWSPVWIGTYDRRWASDTLVELQRLADDPQTGITIKTAEEWLDAEGARELDEDLDHSYWWRDLPGIRWARETLQQSRTVRIPEHPQPIEFVQRVQFRTPVARMPDYLGYLLRRLESHAGCQVRWQWVDALEDLLVSFDWVVNCTGWQAKHLVADEQQRMRLLAGHVVRLPGIPGLPLVTMHHGPFRDLPTYLVPRSGSEEDVICGGTAFELDHLPPQRQPVQTAAPELYDQLQQRGAAFEPRLAGQTALQSLVGLRPMRDAVRIECDARHPQLIHHYGHGGAGLTLSWGSADAAARLVPR